MHLRPLADNIIATTALRVCAAQQSGSPLRKSRWEHHHICTFISRKGIQYKPDVFPACSFHSENRPHPPEFHRTELTCENGAQPLLERLSAALTRPCAEVLERLRKPPLFMPHSVGFWLPPAQTDRLTPARRGEKRQGGRLP